MWVEVVKSIALKPTRSMTGAMVRVLAVSIPTAAHVLWLPSRSEVSTSAISATALLLPGAVALEEACEEAGVDAAAREIRIGEDRGVQAEIGGDAGHVRACQGRAHRAEHGGRSDRPR